ncbi:HAD hydrolase family protein, partial [Bacillus spizizenii]|uniref:HAD hydrolase family protein n=1 Tax=Bacillus spizizenii TaxID=96241 RepID=UPI0036F444F1
MKLIAIYLDGTLLNKESVISVENRAAIKRAVVGGILVTLSAGSETCDVTARLGGLVVRFV